MKELTHDWLKLAFDDLQTSSLLLKENLLTGVVAFHSQQCIEKVFKAILEENNKEVFRTHDLIKLYNNIKELVPIEINIDLMRKINEAYSDTRYPGEMGLLPSGQPSKNEAEEFYNLAKYIYTEIKEKLTLK